jgi:anthranilate/para-aminobenzoate synthase component II
LFHQHPTLRENQKQEATGESEIFEGESEAIGEEEVYQNIPRTLQLAVFHGTVVQTKVTPNDLASTVRRCIRNHGTGLG